MLSIVLPLILALASVLVIMPPFIRRMRAQGFLGKDMNKYNKPLVAELGGVVVFLGFSFGIFSAIFLSTYLHTFTIDLSVLLAGFSTIAMICFIGFIDDIIGWKKGIRQWQHALFPIIAALPLMAIAAGETSMFIPFIGQTQLGIIYSLILIPIGVTGASNAFNMLAGFNGLEAGQGIILTATLTIIALLSGQITAALFGIAMIGALIAFLKFNWFPAKIFGGDSLTLMVGANLAVMSIIGNMETIGLLVIALFVIEFLIKARHKFQSECFGIPNKKNQLSASPKGGSLTQMVMRMGRGKLKEAQVTGIILGIQSILCAGIMIFYLFRII
ncbi:Phospho-N-acetylmuramoyl-pentapeptide-transferase [uncultured archaeon]|nr:Phospho-N-acetylmuramoyl-pentapeptide-transferase [uncultured archaeon]